MADPCIEHWPSWDDGAVPQSWLVVCCWSVPGDDWYSTEQAALDALATHLDAVHGMTVRALPVHSMVPEDGWPLDAAMAGGHLVRRDARSVPVPHEVER